jgi:hypothetical protein
MLPNQLNQVDRLIFDLQCKNQSYLQKAQLGLERELERELGPGLVLVPERGRELELALELALGRELELALELALGRELGRELELALELALGRELELALGRELGLVRALTCML